MSTRRDIRAKITELKRQLAVLEEAEALLDQEPMPRLGVKRRTGPGRGAAHPRYGKLSPKSALGLAQEALRTRGEPMHVDKLITYIQAVDGVRIKKGTLASSLARFSKEGRIFCRTDAPNTFGLREWSSPGVNTTLLGGHVTPELEDSGKEVRTDDVS